MDTKHKPLILSIGLHLGLILVLVLGDFDSTPEPMPVVSQITPIQAVVVDQAKVDNQVKKLKKQKADAAAAEKKRLKDAKQRLANTKKKRLKEEARIKDLERQRKKKVQEKKNADDAAKKSKAKAATAEKNRKKKVAEQKKSDEVAAAAKAKRIKDEVAAKKAAKKVADKKAADKREKAAADKKRKEQEAKERAVQEKLLEQQLAEEMAGRAQARRQQLMSEINRFTALIIETIQRNLITDRSSMEGKSCKLTISLAPSGFVTNVVIGKGDRIVCDAAQKAIYKAGTLPVSKDPEIFKEMRKISVTVIPEF